MIHVLIPAQTVDPGRGSFMVNPKPLKGQKHLGQPVYTSCPEHPYGFSFIIKP